MIVSFNPATEETLASFEPHEGSAIESRLAAAHRAQRAWAATALPDRLALLRRVAARLRDQKASLGLTIALEMGKPLVEAVGEVEKCAWNFDYYAEAAPAMLADEVVASSASDSRIVRDPLGLVLAVMPWNYPLWQVMRAAAPVLAAGNGLVLKHASNVPQCALAIEAVFRDAGAPEGLVTTLLVGAAQVPALIADERIAAVTFTGSTPAGRSIAAAAGQALKKQVLELGGSDPFIVLADADLETAAAVGVKARFQNTGQSCIAAKRFIVEQSVADRFVEAFCEQARRLVVGDPLAAGTTQGAMARANLRDDLHAQVQASLNEGATLCLGGRPVPGRGVFYEPTVLDHVKPAMTAAREETFGPAAAIVRVRDAGEAVAVANGTPFGLGAALWTRDLDRARTLARQVEAGAVFVNGLVASDPRLPFGGIKASGYGRELGRLGLHEFTNAKTVWTGPART
ncbi:NAD-dependent succinate-semialdehyde dehydrogenase [Variovorax saccharolyticus]|uniref:NAD-dependent succinate-semialdehyde dehydrogenase n=1 Tax=Variovorax saccharolyticus TaxID=3053516 RepID=UPI0025760458|nr:NAD-dependent succinate-semialdehyde dehydrogenase [Variovorax sp. J31P216]MDM0029972.1 NAD-dependent succinate-semialdehyde dehydrogenase [Variovorax sp. J31P216]